jgi:hypothetical protein
MTHDGHLHEIPKKSTFCFLKLNSGSENVTSFIPVLIVVNQPPVLLQAVVLLSSVLMNGTKVYAPRIMLLLLLLEPVSAAL